MLSGAWEHAEKQRTGDAVIPQEEKVEEESEEGVGGG